MVYHYRKYKIILRRPDKWKKNIKYRNIYIMQEYLHGITVK